MRTAIFLLSFLIAANASATLPFVGTGDLKNGSVTNVKLAAMANSTIKCNISGGSASPTDCTGDQVGTVVGALIGSKNLSDLSSPATARTNMGLGPAAILAASTVPGATVVSNGTTWIGSTIAVPACSAISASQVDWSLGNCFTKTLSANTTLTFKSPVAGQQILVRLTNTTANYTLTWPQGNSAGASVLWPSSTIPVLTTGQHSDIFTVFFDGTNFYGATPTQNY